MKLMSFNSIAINLNYYDNMTFGEMLDAGFQWNTEKGKWSANIFGASKEVISYFENTINNMIENSCFMYYPAIDNPDTFARALRNEVAQAVSNQAPILQSLFYPQLMPDGTQGGKGQMNITDGGSSGERSADFGTKFPQAMLNGNIGDYGSDGGSRSLKKVSNVSSLDAFIKMDNSNYVYKDTIVKIVEAVETSGVFSAFIY